MKGLNAIFLALIVAAPIAGAADWQILSAESGPSIAAAVEYHHVVVEKFATPDRAIFDLAVFAPRKVRLRVIDNASGNEKLSDAMVREKCVAGVNGGYFDPAFKPIGLRMIDGRITSLLARARLLSALFVASARGFEIMRSGEFTPQRKYESALQCGPLLVSDGRPMRGLDDTRSARRTFAVVGGGGLAGLGVSSALTLAQLANAISVLPFAPGAKVVRAMNFDGGSSTAFWFARKEGNPVSIQEWKSVRDFVGIAPR